MKEKGHNCCKKWKGGFFRRLSIVYRYAKIFIIKESRKADIEDCHPPYLLAIENNPGLSQEEISLHAKSHKGGVAKAIKQMVDRGYVRRVQREEDKRTYSLYLTEKGQEAVPKIKKIEKKFENLLTKDMDKKDKEVFTMLLEQAANNLLEYNQEDGGKN